MKIFKFHESAAPDPIYGPADSDLQPKGLPDFGQSKGITSEKQSRKKMQKVVK